MGVDRSMEIENKVRLRQYYCATQHEGGIHPNRELRTLILPRRDEKTTAGTPRNVQIVDLLKMCHMTSKLEDSLDKNGGSLSCMPSSISSTTSIHMAHKEV